MVDAQMMSITSRLKNRSEKMGVPYNTVLALYFNEALIRRISTSNYSSNFVLKGGLCLYAIYESIYRPTRDIDLLAQHISNEYEEIKSAFKTICSLNCSDGVTFDPVSIKIEQIAADKKYPGNNIRVQGNLGSIKHIVSIDIGYGDVVFPKSMEISYPALLTDEKIILKAYTMESIVAEKMHSIAVRGLLNSRMKDFYDLYNISKTNDFEGMYLLEALKATFDKRHTTFESTIDLFETSFKLNELLKTQWKSYANKMILDYSFETVVDQIICFIRPVFTAAGKELELFERWNKDLNAWIR